MLFMDIVKFEKTFQRRRNEKNDNEIVGFAVELAAGLKINRN